jgi:hypothetical protein
MRVWCRDFIGALLTRDRAERLGAQSGRQVLQHIYFRNVDFDALAKGPSPIDIKVGDILLSLVFRKYIISFSVQLNGPDDFQYFDYFSPEDSLQLPDFADENEGAEDEFLAFNYLA